MSKSLAELRTSDRTSLPERTYELCLSQALVAEAQALAEEKANLAVEVQRLRPSSNADDPDEAARIRKGGVGPNPRLAEIETRVVEIDARLEQIYDEMREHTGTLRLRGVTAGEWRRWVDANPAREDGRDARSRPVIVEFDDAVAYGLCNASALMDRLGDFVVAWNDQPLQTGDWDWLEEKAPPGDLKAIAKMVVGMHESAGVGTNIPKSRKPSSGTPESETS